MRAFVTGAAGFIGSHLVERLDAGGWNVLAVDSFEPNYPRDAKERNIAGFGDEVDFREGDLSQMDLAGACQDVDVVFHLAAIPGVRASWGSNFDRYVKNNVTATSKLLDGIVAAGVPRLVFASSSSVYGNLGARGAVTEQMTPQPFSPYAVSKLAAEHLCAAHAGNFGFDAVSLRLFTVYGPRQRPDMAVHRLVETALRGGVFEVYGDGSQVRDMTFVGDVITALEKAAVAPTGGFVTANIAGGTLCSLRELVDLVGELSGEEVCIRWGEKKPGDVDRTDAVATLAASLLNWHPQVSLQVGIERQLDWHRTG